jgi:hypothetical protein
LQMDHILLQLRRSPAKEQTLHRSRD